MLHIKRSLWPPSTAASILKRWPRWCLCLFFSAVPIDQRARASCQEVQLFRPSPNTIAHTRASFWWERDFFRGLQMCGLVIFGRTESNWIYQWAQAILKSIVANDHNMQRTNTLPNCKRSMMIVNDDAASVDRVRHIHTIYCDGKPSIWSYEEFVRNSTFFPVHPSL